MAIELERRKREEEMEALLAEQRALQEALLGRPMLLF